MIARWISQSVFLDLKQWIEEGKSSVPITALDAFEANTSFYKIIDVSETELLGVGSHLLTTNATFRDTVFVLMPDDFLDEFGTLKSTKGKIYFKILKDQHVDFVAHDAQSHIDAIRKIGSHADCKLHTVNKDAIRSRTISLFKSGGISLKDVYWGDYTSQIQKRLDVLYGEISSITLTSSQA